MCELQENKKQERLREKLRNNKAACIITRSIRRYAKTVRTGMGFTIRRIRESILAHFVLLLLLLICFAADHRDDPRINPSTAKGGAHK
jgi:hypothetical protein